MRNPLKSLWHRVRWRGWAIRLPIVCHTHIRLEVLQRQVYRGLWSFESRPDGFYLTAGLPRKLRLVIDREIDL